jgi:hypothetical protein
MLHLSELLSGYLQSEEVGPVKFHCLSCGYDGDVSARKQLKLALPAPYVEFSLKWAYTSSVHVVKKECEVPSVLSVPCTDGEVEYSLRSIVVHQGSTSSSGHYVAYVRRGQSEWYLCDDHIICPVQVGHSMRFQTGEQQPYMVFYERSSMSSLVAAPSVAIRSQHRTSVNVAPAAAAAAAATDGEWTTASGKRVHRFRRHPKASPAVATDDNPFKGLLEDEGTNGDTGEASTVVGEEEGQGGDKSGETGQRAGKKAKRGKRKGKQANKRIQELHQQFKEKVAGEEEGLLPFVKQLLRRPHFLPLSPQSVHQPEEMQAQMLAKIEQQMAENGGELLTKKNPRTRSKIQDKLAGITRSDMFHPRHGLALLRYIGERMTAKWGPWAIQGTGSQKKKGKSEGKETGGAPKRDERMLQTVSLIRIILNWLMDDETGYGGYFQVCIPTFDFFLSI